MTVRVSAEYVDDLPYVRHFIADLSPARLRLVAALNGLVPPPDADFDYCELGCAHGDTLAALAAAYPESRFLGVDLSAAHVASAKRLARRIHNQRRRLKQLEEFNGWQAGGRTDRELKDMYRKLALERGNRIRELERSIALALL